MEDFEKSINYTFLFNHIKIRYVMFSDTETDMLEGEPPSASCVQGSMIRGILQFTLLIALRCALHRYGNQDIHR